MIIAAVSLLIISIGIFGLKSLGLAVATENILEVVLDIGLYGVIGWFTLLYWRQCKAIAKQNQPSFYAKLKQNLPVLLIMAAVLPFHSTDMFGYINRGAQQVLFGLNPYLHPLADVPHWQNNPLFTAHWVDNPSPYGPFFNALAAGVIWVSGQHFWLAFAGFKLMNFGLFLLLGFLIFDLARQFKLEAPVYRSVLFLLSPLIVLQNLANGHNDLWIPVGILGAWWLFLKPKWQRVSIPLLSLSVLVKFSSILALPFLMVGFIQGRQWRGLTIGIILSATITAILGLVYFQDITSFPWDKLTQNAGIAQHSLNSMLSRIVFYLGQFIPALEGLFMPVRQGLKPLLWGLFSTIYTVILWRFARPKQSESSPLDPPELTAIVHKQLMPVAMVLTLMVTVISAKFHPWYVAMFFPVTLLLPLNHWLFRFGLYLSLFQLLAFTPIRNIHVLNYLILTLIPLILAFKNTRKPQNEAITA